MYNESLAHVVPEVSRTLLGTGLEVIGVTYWQRSGFDHEKAISKI